ncbi:MAG: DUF4258 domain-containing protein [Vicinamibacterales bacterium]
MMNVRITPYAFRRMYERRITIAQVLAAVQTGTIVAEWPNRKPVPSRELQKWFDRAEFKRRIDQ